MSGAVSVDLKGLRELVGNSKVLEKLVMTEVAAGVYVECEDVMGHSKDEFCPVDVGALKSTGHVDPPVIEGSIVTVDMGYGGPSGVMTKDGKDYVGYALYVHEGTQSMDGSKYLEKPTYQAAPHMGPHILAKVEAAIEKRF
jgi:hypothetical protein